MMSASDRFSNDVGTFDPYCMLTAMASSCSIAQTCASASALEILSSPGVPLRSPRRQGSRDLCCVCPSPMLSGQMGYCISF